MGAAIENSTAQTYGSALNSYLSFVKTYAFSVEPNPDTLSLYIVYMCEHIKPQSVETYLTGLCHELSAQFPEVRQWRSSYLVSRTMKGCKKLKGTHIKRKRALTTSDLSRMVTAYPKPSHDDNLFIAMITTGFFALMRLGELSYPDNENLRNPAKIIRRHSVDLTEDSYSFSLPFHKADKFFEGNRVIVKSILGIYNPFKWFSTYLLSRDQLFPFHSALWLTMDGEIPSRSFFIKHLRLFCGTDTSGHSMRAGGATWLAEQNTPPHLIQAIGRWSSDAWQIYVRKNPVLIQALLQSSPRTHLSTSTL